MYQKGRRQCCLISKKKSRQESFLEITVPSSRFPCWTHVALKALTFIPAYNVLWSNLPPSPVLQPHCFASPHNFMYLPSFLNLVSSKSTYCYLSHLLENGWPLRARIPEKNGLLPLAWMIAPQRGIELLIPSSIPSVLRFWPVWSCAGLMHVVAAQHKFHMFTTDVYYLWLYIFSAHPFWDGYWNSGIWYRCPI